MVVRFHGALNDLVAKERRGVDIACAPGATDTLLHVVESLGIPHTEIGRIQHDGERIDVFPPEIPVRIEGVRFVLDGHLGRLCAYLRMLGFDCWHQPHPPDPLLARVSAGEDRLLLSRDLELFKRREIRSGYFVRATDPRLQLREVAARFALAEQMRPFTRCLRCNELLRPVPREPVLQRLPPRVAQLHTEFSECPACRRLFWQGTHWERMLEVIRSC